VNGAGPIAGAIVFTDIVGFTHFTLERGDDVALELLDRKAKLVRNALPGTGRVVKELGDGLLLWFDDACDALQTCIALQCDFERESTDDLPLWVRMGLHWGNPRRRGDDILGHDVNLTARIVELAGPGEVLCSAVAVEVALGQAGGVPGIAFEELGAVFVRGLDDPVPLVRAVPVSPWPCV
jgi:class 3 adenylate cyclase